ncbi:MAG TPA: VCBS domain-containing protein, partial [Vicinamibacterales bacterium]|nr:VCBS domain-containing protein [Vicinamibacterales bacterium]
YSTASQNPSTTARSIAIQVNDGAAGNNLSGEVTSTVTINAVNDEPTGGAPVTLFLKKGTSYTFRADDFSIASDAEGHAVSAIKVVNPRSTGTTGTLQKQTSPGVWVAAVADDVVSIGNLRWAAGSDDNSDAKFTFQVVDSGGTANSGDDTSATLEYSIDHVNADNNKINPGGTQTAQTFTEGGSAVTVFGALTVPNNAAATKAIVRISGNYAAGDTLTWTNSGTVTGNYSGGVLSLSGTATDVQWQAILRSVQFSTSGDNPSPATRTVTASFFSGSQWSDSVATNTVAIKPVNDAPMLSSATTTLAYNAGGAAAAINPYLFISDVDNTALFTATVSITGNFNAAQDVLSFSNDGSTMGNIAGSYNSGTGVYSLSSTGGTATLAQWESALQAVKYNNSSGSPDTATRTVSYAITADSVGVALAGNTSNSSTTLSGLSSTSNLAVGMAVSGTGIPAGTTITAIPSATSVILSAAATANATGVSLTFDRHASNTVSSSTITVSAVNAAPQVTVAGSALAYTENATTAVDGALTITDTDSANLAGATVRITNYVAGQDVLAFTSQFGIAGTFDTATGVLTLSGAATKADYQTVLRSVTYSNSSDNPATTARNVVFQVTDGGASNNLSNLGTRSITIGAANDTPVLSTPSAVTYNDSPASDSFFAVTGTLTVSDIDGPSTTYSVTGDSAASGGPAGYDRQRAGTYGTLYLNSVTGAYTYIPSNAAINAVGAASPSETFTFSVTDGTLTDTDTLTINIAGVNDAPILNASGSAATYTENGAALAVNSSITVSDADHAMLAGATVSITSGYQAGQDVLGFANDGATMGNIAVSSNAGGVLTLASAGNTATLAQWQAALRAVTYSNSSEDPTAGTRQFSFQVSDGSLSSNVVGAADITVNVAPVNDAPVLANTGGAAFTEDAGAVTVNSGLTLTDVDDTNIESATVWIQNFVAGDTLAVGAPGGLTVNTSTPGQLTLTGSATKATYETALRSITYSTASQNPDTAARRINFQVSDGTDSSNTLASTVTIAAVNDAPVLGGSAGTVGYTENGAGMVINPTVTVSDVDSAGLASAAITLTNVKAGDVLAFTNDGSTMGNIAVSSSLAGELTLTSAGNTATAAEWQAALRSVTFSNTSESPDTTQRSVTFRVNDGAANSNLLANRTVDITSVNDAPVVGGTPTTVAFIENGSAVAVNTSITLRDADTASMSGAAVAISNFVFGQDVLSFTGQNGITGTFDTTTGVLTLSGSASVADYQAALRSITYSNASEAPNTTTRSIAVTVNDGAAASNTFTTSVSVAAVNDAPTRTTAGVILDSVLEDAAAPVGAVGTLVSSLVAGQSDVDAGPAKGIAITSLGTASGAWYYSTDGGANWTAITSAPTNAAALLLASDASTRLFFKPSANFNGTVNSVISFRAWDQTSGSNGAIFDTSANGGTTAFSSAVDTASITVTAVNDAPVGADNIVWVDKNGSYTFGAADFGFTDPVEGSSFAGVVISTLPASGTLKLSGVDVAAGQFIAAADIPNLVYAPGANLTGLGLASFRFQVRDTGGTNDGGVDTDPTQRAMLFNVGSRTPAVLSGGSTLDYIETDVPLALAINPGIQVFDADNATLERATLNVSRGFQPGEDVIAFTNNGSTMGNITASWDAVNGVMTLTSAGATATHAEWQSALRSITYKNVSDAPNVAQRLISFTLYDGTQDSNVVQSTVDLEPINDAPVVTASGSTLGYVENQAAAPIDAGIVVTDPDSPPTFDGGFLQVNLTANGAAEDQLTVLNIGNGAGQIGVSGTTVSYEGVAIGTIDATLDGVNGRSLRINLTAGSSPAALQALARAVAYSNTSDAPSTATRSVNFVVNDGGNYGTGGPLQTTSVTDTITVASVNDAPTGANSTFAVQTGGYSYTFGQLDFGFTDPLDQPDNSFAAVLITGLPGGGLGTLERFNGTTWVPAAVNDVVSPTALRYVAGSVAAGGNAGFTFRVIDDGGTVNSGQNTDQTDRTMSIVVTPGPIPVVASGVTDRSFTENGSAITLYPTLDLAHDAARHVTQATITVSGFGVGDALAFTANGSTGDISASINAGTLTLTSANPAALNLAHWEAALQAVTYVNTSDTLSTAARQVALVVTDDLGAPSTPARNLINVTALNDAPVLDNASPALASITENQTAHNGQTVASFVGSTINDADGASVVEGIAVTGTSLSSGAGTWQYSLDGATWSTISATPASALLLRAQDYIRFVPDGQNAASASLTYRAWDQTSGAAGSSADTGTTGGTSAFSAQQNSVSIAVTAVNDAPALSGNLTLQSINEDAATNNGRSITQLLTDSFVSLQDVDSGASLAGIALIGNSANVLTEGRWQYSTDGASWFDVGTVADGPTALALSTTTQLRFQPVADYYGTPPALSFRALDNTYSAGFTNGATRTTVDTTASGGATAVDGTVRTIATAINVVNDVPLRTAGSVAALSVVEDSGTTSLGLGAVAYSPGSPANESAQALTYTVTTVPGASLGDVVLSDGTTVVAAGNSYTLAQIRGMQFRAAPNASGSGTFAYAVQDSGGIANGGVDTLTESLLITVAPVNDAPTIHATLTSASYADTSADDTFSSVTGTLAGSSDADVGDSLSFGLAGSAADASEAGYDRSTASPYGTLYLNATTGAYKFVANDTAIEALQSGQNPTAIFTVTVSDGVAAPVSQAITVNFNGSNDAAVLSSATVALAETDAALTTGGTLSNADLDNAQTF